MFGYFFFDWADSSTPITVKPENREIYPDFVSCYGARPGGTYYLYNVPEELDAEGEWYLDRGTGNLSSDSPVFRALPDFRAIPAENIGFFR